MIDVNATKYRTKAAAISKFKRLLPSRTQGAARRPEADAVASELAAGNGGVVPQSVAENNGAVSPEVDVPDLRGGAGRPAGEFPVGKDPALDLRDREMSSVAYYVRDINGNWRRCVEFFINVGRLCAEANARLTATEKSELMPSLPFGEATFSKFVRIGTDTRLHVPDVQRLLPAHYTTTYHISLLTDEELKQAIAEKVICPDMKRDHLRKWRNSRREKVAVAPSPNDSESDTAIADQPTTPTKDAVQSGALPSTKRVDNRNMQEELAAAPKAAPTPEFVATAPVVAAPLTPARGEDDIPPFLDRRPLSAEDQRTFDAIMAALKAASAVVRERVKAELIRANGWSGSAAKAVSSRRRDDDDSAIPNQPTESVVPAYTADAAERAEGEKPEPAGEAPLGVTPDALEQVRPKRRPRKARGFLDDAPF